MYAQCPDCETVFRVKPEQLKARAGWVRCGHCKTVFQADQHLMDRLPKKPKEPKKERPAKKPKDEKPKIRKPKLLTAAPLRPAEPLDPSVAAPLLYPKRRWPIPGIAWSMLAALALIGFVGQSLYYFRNDWVKHEWLTDAMHAYCNFLGCEFDRPKNIALIELLDQTSIAPHPKFENVLRLRASLVNRADFAQAFPAMEVSLTDSNGDLLARRHFAPRQYLETPTLSEGAMPAGLVVRAMLEITNPDQRAIGYEIRLIETETKQD